MGKYYGDKRYESITGHMLSQTIDDCYVDKNKLIIHFEMGRSVCIAVNKETDELIVDYL
jgi:hypothetical protein